MGRANVDRETVGCLVLDFEIEDLDISPVRIAGCASQSHDSTQAMAILLHLTGLVARTHVLSVDSLRILDVG